MEFDVIVIGGGPAGSTAAIVMARAGLRVHLVEKDEFPRHKLCGEFLSGDGTEILSKLQLDDTIISAGAVPINRCLVSSTAGARFEAHLPGRPLSLTRYRLDLALLDEARRSGSEVTTGSAVTDVTGSLENGFEVVTSGRTLTSRAVLLACGRSSQLDRRLGLFKNNPARDPLVAFKAHYDGPHMPGTVELHSFRGGYCGIQPVEDSHVNVCWITRASTLRASGGKPDHMVKDVFADNRLLADRAAPLVRRTEAFLAVSQLDLRPRQAVAGDLLLAGDSAGMIAPMCGDGMSMAITSGVMAAQLIEAFLAGRIGAAEMKERYRRRWRKMFTRRMWVGRLLHMGYERSRLSDLGIRACQRFPGAGEWLIRATRS